MSEQSTSYVLNGAPPVMTIPSPAVPMKPLLPLEILTQIADLVAAHPDAQIVLDFHRGVLAHARLGWDWRRVSERI